MNAAVLRYVLARIAQSVALIGVVYVALFFVVTVLPGDPISNRLADPASGYSQAQIDELKEYYGLHRPLMEQFFSGVGGMFHLDLGLSLSSNREVTAMLGDVLPSTLGLTSAAFVLAVLLGAAVALGATFLPVRSLRTVLKSFPPVFFSVPGFLVGMLLIQVLSFRFGLFETLRDEGIKAVILPALTLAIPASAPIAQVFLVSLRQTRSQTFVAVAISKGLSGWGVVRGHILRPSAIPVASMVAVCAAELLGGAVIVEAVFARQGIGSLVEKAVIDQDLPVLQGVVLVTSAVCISANLVVDLVQPLLDPRVRSARA